MHEWIGNMHHLDYFLVTSADELPDKSFVQKSFQQSATSSMLIVPIRYQGNLVGFIGSSTIDPFRTWKQDEISLFRVIGEAFVNAITRMNSEKVLIESERNYREIFNATKEAIFIHDATTGEVLDVNHSAIQLFGFSHEEALSSNANLFSVTEEGFDHSLAVNYIKQALSKETVVFEWLAKRKNGKNFWAEVSLKYSEIGGDMRVLAVVRDISERKKSEELMRQSEERFRSIIQYLTDIIWIIDSKNRIIFESPSSWHVLGYDPGYLLGKPGLKLIHPEDLSKVKTDLKEVFKKQNDYLPTEFRAKHKDGHWISLEAIANNMLDHPAIHGIIITCRDITERKIVEKALKLSESRFRNIFNNSSDAIVITGSNFSILEVNEVFLKITGYPLPETKKMKFSDIITDTYLPQLADQFMRFFQHENLPALECEIKCMHHPGMPVEINSKLIEFEGQPALVSIIRDITERKQIESRILDTILSTEEREREKFARNLHDELGPLLSSIKMYVNSLASSVDPQKNEFVMSQLKKILSEAIRSTKELSNDLSPHVLSSYGLVAALEWFIDQLKPYIRIVFESNLKDERYPSMLELSIYRIIKELINNTLKHAQANAIHIKLHTVLKSVHLYYSDNGKGFPENWQDHYQFMGMGMSNIMSRCRSIKAISRFYNHAPAGMSFEMDVPVE
jgi:PAS domain S-box-containing protein